MYLTSLLNHLSRADGQESNQNQARLSRLPLKQELRASD